MKRFLNLTLLAFLFVFIPASWADVATLPTNLSPRDIADWGIRGGHIGSGTGALPAVGPVGSRYTDITDPLAPVEYRSNGVSWVSVSGGGMGAAGATGPQGIPGPIGATGSQGIPGENPDPSLYQPVASMSFYQLTASMSDYLLANTAATEFVGSSAFATEHDARLASEAAIRALVIPNPASTGANVFTGGQTVNGSMTVLGQTTVASGAGVTFDNDPDTKIFSPGANRIAMLAGGSNFFSGGDSSWVKLGRNAGGTTQAVNNVAIGENALFKCTSGDANVAVGNSALYTITTAGANVGIGGLAGGQTTGGVNTFVGYYAGSGSGAHAGGCAFGYNSGASLTSGNYNSMFGYYSGQALTTGQKNSFYGYGAGFGATQTASVFNSTAIGASTYTTASNQAVIGDANVNDVQFGQGGTLARLTATQSFFPLPVYCASDCSALSFTDRSDAPATLVQAMAIVESHESLNGRIDHSKLDPAAWGKKTRIEPTGKMTTVSITEETPIPPEELEAVEPGKEPVTTITTTRDVLVPETRQIEEPDQSKRNLSMVVSAQALVIKDLQRRLLILEGKQ